MCIDTAFRAYVSRRQNRVTGTGMAKEIEWHSLKEIIITNNPTAVPFLLTIYWIIVINISLCAARSACKHENRFFVLYLFLEKEKKIAVQYNQLINLK